MADTGQQKPQNDSAPNQDGMQLPPPPPPGSAPPPNIEHVTLSELAQWARCSTRTIQRLLEVGSGPPALHISNRRIIFRVGDVRDWLEKRRFSRRAHPQL
jgi:predicted DNA-binding transcriptional regulator AlpA